MDFRKIARIGALYHGIRHSIEGDQGVGAQIPAARIGAAPRIPGRQVAICEREQIAMQIDGKEPQTGGVSVPELMGVDSA